MANALQKMAAKCKAFGNDLKLDLNLPLAYYSYVKQILMCSEEIGENPPKTQRHKTQTSHSNNHGEERRLLITGVSPANISRH